MADDRSEIDVIVDTESGLVAPIYARDKGGRTFYSWGIFKEFERAGRTERTAYLEKHHVGAARKMLAKIEDRIELAEDRDRGAAREKEREKELARDERARQRALEARGTGTGVR
jgi:hypothetical protein